VNDILNLPSRVNEQRHRDLRDLDLGIHRTFGDRETLARVAWRPAVRWEVSSEPVGETSSKTRRAGFAKPSDAERHEAGLIAVHVDFSTVQIRVPRGIYDLLPTCRNNLLAPSSGHDRMVGRSGLRFGKFCWRSRFPVISLTGHSGHHARPTVKYRRVFFTDPRRRQVLVDAPIRVTNARRPPNSAKAKPPEPPMPWRPRRMASDRSSPGRRPPLPPIAPLLFLRPASWRVHRSFLPITLGATLTASLAMALSFRTGPGRQLRPSSRVWSVYGSAAPSRALLVFRDRKTPGRWCSVNDAGAAAPDHSLVADQVAVSPVGWWSQSIGPG